MKSFLLIFIMITSLSGCTGFEGKTALDEANAFFAQADYQSSLARYEDIVAEYPVLADKALFEMGIIYAYAKNEHKDYRKASESFQKVVEDHPKSPYRHDSEMMIFYLQSAAMKDERISAQQARIDALQRELKSKASDITALQTKIEALERKTFLSVLEHGSADRILIEKKARRLTLLSKGEVIKSYRIALGGNPDGPKEREGDHKTPEGTYVIDSRKKDTEYHLSLHISYPNEKDKKRAKEMGVAPGGDIMIHGIKRGLAWVGESHRQVDWTQGCIAVTDEEIEEIARLAPNGTVVEIRP